MVIRPALAGVALVLAGALDLGGFREVTIAVGALALAASGVTWAVTSRRGGSS